MYLNSRRIAPFGLYTSRSDIPRYQTYGNRTALHFAHVIDSARNVPAPPLEAGIAAGAEAA